MLFKYMKIKTYIKVDIHFVNTTFKKIRSGEEKNMNKLMKFIQIVLTNSKEQIMQRILSNVDILIHPLTFLQIRI